MANKFTVPPNLARLKGADAVVLRQIILALAQEIERLRARLDAGGL
jgi:hypothetical protein